MSARRLKNRTSNSESGFSLIELMIAGAVLTVGFLALIILLTTAIANNTRSKTDTSAVMLAQSLVEQVNSTLGSATGITTLTDCAGNTWNINSAGTTTGTGAALSSSSIDFSEASPPDGYYMNFVVCSGTQQTTYDVRWHVQLLEGGGYSSATYLLTVGAKMKNAGNQLRYFTLPVDIRALVGQ